MDEFFQGMCMMKKNACLVFAVTAFLQVPAATAQNVAQLANKNLKIVAEQQGARVVFKLQTPAGIDVLVAGPPRETNTAWKHTLRPELFSRLSGKDEPFFFTSVEQAKGSRTLRFSGGNKNVSLMRETSLAPDYPAAYVIDKWRIGPAAKVEALLSSFNFSPRGKSYSDMRPLDFIWTPNLRPQLNDVIADHVFRSPAIMLQKDSIFVALIPDLQYLVKHRAMPMAMDFLLPPLRQPDSTSVKKDSLQQTVSAVIDRTSSAPVLTFGFWPWKTREPGYYQPDSTRAPKLQETEISYAYYLWLEPRAAPYMRPGFEKSKNLNSYAFRRLVDFFWEKFSPRYRENSIGPLPATLDALAQRAWKQYADNNWFETALNGRPIGGVKNGPLAAAGEFPTAGNNGVWFTGRAQALRSAYGMYLFGKRNQDILLMQRAEKVLNLALSAPNENGIFPSIFYLSSLAPNSQLKTAVINLSNQKFSPQWTGETSDDEANIVDAAWTGYWLLKWANLLSPRRPQLATDKRPEKILAFCRQYADFLLQHQQLNGAIPRRFHRADNLMRPMALNENAETAGAALFLAEFYNRVKEPRYLAAAAKAMDYITREILPGNKWLDFETLITDSSQSAETFDAMTGQFSQGTSSMHQAAKAYLALHQITANEAYLNLGRHVLDYLLLYQQVWSPPYFSRNLFGGFGAQNNAAAWSDARQAYIAETLMDYFEATNKRAYFERAIAAMRATFALFHRDSPMCYENWAPNGDDSPGTIAGLDWGTGSAATTFELLRERTGDAYVFLGEKPGTGGANAVWIENLRAKNDSIRFNLVSSLGWGRSVWVKFFEVKPGRYRVKINDGAVIPFTDVLLKRSIYMPAKRVSAATHLPPEHFYNRSPKPWQIDLKVAGARPDFTAQLYLRPEPAGKSGRAAFQTVPFQANSDNRAWTATLPESYKRDGTRFQYYITWNRSGKTQRLPAATEAEEFYSGATQPFMLADCGDDDEAYLGEEKDSWISSLPDADDHSRVVEGEQWFSYAFPIQPQTKRVKLAFFASGACRVAIGETILLTEDPIERNSMREHTFTLDNPQLWTTGKLILRFSDANPKDSEAVNVGWIKVEENAGEN